MLKQVLPNHMRNKIHTALLMLTLIALLGLMGLILFGGTGFIWIIALGGLFLLLTPVMPNAWLLKLQRAIPITYNEAPWLHQVTNQLAYQAGIEAAPRLFFLPNKAGTAFTIGQKDDYAIGLSQGLLRQLNERELQGVLAHEISHIKNKDLPLRNLAHHMSSLTRMMSMIGQIIVLFNLPLILFGLTTISLPLIALLILAPAGAVLVELALSRARELEADQSAAQMTNDPRGLANALMKLDNKNRPVMMRLLFPYAGHQHSSWLSTHPDTNERVKRLLAMDDQQKKGVYADFVDYSPNVGW